MYSRKRFALSALLACTVFATGSLLAEEKSALALGGYDTVAYFTMNKAVKGKAQFSAQYLGKTWHFANTNHKKLFEANPAKYAPQYGGYCAWGIATKDDFFPSAPTVFAIHDGKLYLNYDSDVAKDWNQNRAGFIKDGDKNYARSQKPIATEVND